MTTYPPSPFPRKGVTLVQPLRGFRVIDLMPRWGPRGNVAPRNVRSGALPQFGSTVQLRGHGRYAEFLAEAS